MGCRPLDERVGCEAMPAGWLIGWKGGRCLKDLNVPEWVPVAWRLDGGVGAGEPNTGGGARRWAGHCGKRLGVEMIHSWKAKDGELVDKTKTTKLDKI